MSGPWLREEKGAVVLVLNVQPGAARTEVVGVHGDGLKIRLAAPESATDRLKDISVLEIINDDMPFLVDSVLGELADRGVEVLLVAHPVISVTRDPAGRVKSFGENGNGAALRESVIHIHIGRIDDEYSVGDRERSGQFASKAGRPCSESRSRSERTARSRGAGNQGNGAVKRRLRDR